VLVWPADGVMRIEVSSLGSLSAEHRAEWGAMQKACIALWSPFLSPEFAVAVGRVKPRARVAVMSEGGVPLAYFPFERSRFRKGRAIGAGVSDCQGIVHRPNTCWNPHELLRACEIDSLEFDHLASGQKSFWPFVTRTERSPIMDLSGGFGAYLERLRGGAKSAFRKYRQLKRDYEGVRFEYGSQDESALTALMRLKSAQYRRTGHRDPFERAWIVELVRHLHRTHSDGATGILSVLWAGGAPVAAHLGLCSDRILAGWFTAYDPAFRKYSPGAVSLMLMAQAAAERGIEQIDLGKGANAQKERFKTGDFVVAEAQVSLRTPLAMAHHVRRESTRRLERVVLDHPRTARRALGAMGTVRSRMARSAD
jgi:CelD/BcsL family acetyltransferase involved in cellulose biosynthesis